MCVNQIEHNLLISLTSSCTGFAVSVVRKKDERLRDSLLLKPIPAPCYFSSQSHDPELYNTIAEKERVEDSTLPQAGQVEFGLLRSSRLWLPFAHRRWLKDDLRAHLQAAATCFVQSVRRSPGRYAH